MRFCGDSVRPLTDWRDEKPLYEWRCQDCGSTFRNLEPKSMLEETKHLIGAPWDKKVKDGLGTRPASLRKSYEMKPETPVAPPAS
jgi:hypothetical protein